MRANGSVETITATSTPRRVSNCGPSFTAAFSISLKRALASRTRHFFKNASPVARFDRSISFVGKILKTIDDHCRPPIFVIKN
jgi:hypothetical protein